MVRQEIIAAFKGEYVTEAGIKDTIKKGASKLHDRITKFHHKSMLHHKNSLHDIDRDPSSASPGDHLYHKVMHAFHKNRYSSMVNGKPSAIHKTVNPKKIEPKMDKSGEKKPAASRAEQAAYQHHRENANNLAHEYNQKVVKGKKGTKTASSIKSLHDEHHESAKAIRSKRSLPKAKVTKPKDTPEAAEKEIKRHGNFGKKRSDETKKKISDAAKSRHAARRAEKEKADRAAKRAEKKATKPKMPKGEEKLKKHPEPIAKKPKAGAKAKTDKVAKRVRTSK